MLHGLGSHLAAPEVLHSRNYRLLCAGQGMALLGEQMRLIALPWLALQITGDAFALGTVLAAGGIPPALLMLVGGVTTDRFSPRTLMLVSDAIRLVLTGWLIVSVLAGAVSLWALYAVSLAFGLLTAFSTPAAGAIVPALVPNRSLQTANSFYMSLTQLAAFVGPALAGILIASTASPLSAQASPSTTGIALAFGIGAVGLSGSVITLWMMRLPPQLQPPTRRSNSSFLSSISAGFSYAWRDPLLRSLLSVILAANLLLTGPLAVGIPVLSNLRLEGAAAFGLIASAFGGGNLLGTLLAGAVQRSKGLGAMLSLLFVSFGVALGAMSWVRATWLAFLILFLVGIANGYLGTVLRTLLHRTTPRELLGRVMSLYFFAKAALVPVSQTVSGAVIDWSLDGLFLISGVLLCLVALGLVWSPAPRLFELQVEQARREP